MPKIPVPSQRWVLGYLNTKLEIAAHILSAGSLRWMSRYSSASPVWFCVWPGLLSFVFPFIFWAGSQRSSGGCSPGSSKPLQISKGLEGTQSMLSTPYFCTWVALWKGCVGRESPQGMRLNRCLASRGLRKPKKKRSEPAFHPIGGCLGVKHGKSVSPNATGLLKRRGRSTKILFPLISRTYLQVFNSER